MINKEKILKQKEAKIEKLLFEINNLDKVWDYISLAGWIPPFLFAFKNIYGKIFIYEAKFGAKAK
jgi:hypothetical protein